MKQEILWLLQSLEWSSSRQGPGSGPMDSGGDGTPCPACPKCGGIKPSGMGKALFVRDALGHRKTCELAKAIKDFRK